MKLLNALQFTDLSKFGERALQCYCIVMVSVVTFADMCWLLSPPQGVVCVVTAISQSEASLATLHQSEAGTQPSPGPQGPAAT